MDKRTLIHCGTLIDAVRPEPLAKRTVVVEDGRIARVEAGFTAPADGDAVLDWSEHVIIPGLFDCHDHLTMDFEDADDPQDGLAVYLTARAARNCRRLLKAGITTMRDLGAKDSLNIPIKRAVQAGLIKGPDVITSGRMIVRTGYPEWPICREASGPEGFRNAVRLERKAGAELCKLMVTGSVAGEGTTPEAEEMRQDEIEAAITEAHALGLKVAAHAYGGPAATNAILAGVDFIEHGAWLKPSDLEEMARRGTWLVVTYGVFPYIVELPNLPDWMKEKARGAMAKYLSTLALVKQAGVRVATGGDGYHADPAVEIKALRDGGFSPMEALQAATRNGAEVCGMGKTKGTVEAGKIADLVALGGDPLADPMAVRDVRAVVKAGEIHG